jgi:hypothetical protein
MYCPNCGKEVREGTKFCPNCGGAQGLAGIVPDSVPQANRYSDSSATAQQAATKRSRAPIIAIIAVICACAVAGILFLPGLLGGGRGEEPPTESHVETSNNGQTGAESQSPVSREPLIAESAGIGDVIEIAGSKYKWRILGKTDGKALLITDEIIDMRAYNELTAEQRALVEDENHSWDGDDFATTWTECSLRKWLNEDFFKTLPDAMQQQVTETDVVNDDNSEYGTSGGEDTLDKIFCLSINEANEYFSDDLDRITKLYPGDAQIKDIAERLSNNPLFNTREEYSTVENAETAIKGYLDEYENNIYWWLRSPGDSSDYAAIVGHEGVVIYDGLNAYRGLGGARPALWLNL